MLLLTVLCLAAGFCFSAETANADTSDRNYYHTYLSGYAVEMDIKSNRTISVTEDITVYFYGNSGFIRDIPVNAGEAVKNIRVNELKGKRLTDVYYDVFVEDSRFISIDIGDKAHKRDEHTYRITYDYCLTRAQEGKNVLALTPIGLGWECEIENVSLTLKLPEGYVSNSVRCFTQNLIGSSETVSATETVQDGRTVITASLDLLYNHALRVDLEFTEGALTTYFDFTPYYFVIAATVLLLIVLLVKFLCFNKLPITPVVNFEAPDKMDPLMMGKLIDNKVNSEDITSMIYYWADKGYLKINLDNQEDPSIIRIVKTLPKECPAYEVVMFNELFSGGEVIKPSSLKYSFYTTVDRVTKMVNGETKNLYNGASVKLSIFFAVLAAIIFGLAPLILAVTQISTSYLIFAPLLVLIPLPFVYTFSLGIKYNSLKPGVGVKIGMGAAAVAIGLITTFAYAFFVPSNVIGFIPKLILGATCCATAGLSVLIVSRTKEYTTQLNEIIGFKNFITLAEKDKLEKMIEDDPEFYYHVLPYAQVLGVSDKWEEKFKDITVQPPQWATGSSMHTFVNFYVFNRIMRTSMANVGRNMVSRPSSSGVSGGSGSSGGFGGFSGGGHGGGGGRFR